MNIIKTSFIDDGVLIITENVDGAKYILTSKHLTPILEDWSGKCEFVPENDARVYFAMFNYKIINPYDTNTFEDLIEYLKDYYNI